MPPKRTQVSVAPNPQGLSINNASTTDEPSNAAHAFKLATFETANFDGPFLKTSVFLEHLYAVGSALASGALSKSDPDLHDLKGKLHALEILSPDAQKWHYYLLARTSEELNDDFFGGLLQLYSLSEKDYSPICRALSLAAQFFAPAIRDPGVEPFNPHPNIKNNKIIEFIHRKYNEKLLIVQLRKKAEQYLSHIESEAADLHKLLEHGADGSIIFRKDTELAKLRDELNKASEEHQAITAKHEGQNYLFLKKAKEIYIYNKLIVELTTKLNDKKKEIKDAENALEKIKKENEETFDLLEQARQLYSKREREYNVANSEKELIGIMESLPLLKSDYESSISERDKKTKEFTERNKKEKNTLKSKLKSLIDRKLELEKKAKESETSFSEKNKIFENVTSLEDDLLKLKTELRENPKKLDKVKDLISRISTNKKECEKLEAALSEKIAGGSRRGRSDSYAVAAAHTTAAVAHATATVAVQATTSIWNSLKNTLSPTLTTLPADSDKRSLSSIESNQRSPDSPSEQRIREYLDDNLKEQDELSKEENEIRAQNSNLSLKDIEKELTERISQLPTIIEALEEVFISSLGDQSLNDRKKELTSLLSEINSLKDEISSIARQIEETNPKIKQFNSLSTEQESDLREADKRVSLSKINFEKAQTRYEELATSLNIEQLKAQFSAAKSEYETYFAKYMGTTDSPSADKIKDQAEEKINTLSLEAESIYEEMITVGRALKKAEADRDDAYSKIPDARVIQETESKKQNAQHKYVQACKKEPKATYIIRKHQVLTRIINIIDTPCDNESKKITALQKLLDENAGLLEFSLDVKSVQASTIISVASFGLAVPVLCAVSYVKTGSFRFWQSNDTRLGTGLKEDASHLAPLPVSREHPAL